MVTVPEPTIAALTTPDPLVVTGFAVILPEPVTVLSEVPDDWVAVVVTVPEPVTTLLAVPNACIAAMATLPEPFMLPEAEPTPEAPTVVATTEPEPVIGANIGSSN